MADTKDDTHRPNRLKRRLDRIRKVRHSTPTLRQKIAGFAFGTATACGTIYACLAYFDVISFNFAYLGIFLLFGATLGALFGWRSIGKAGLEGIGSGVWVFSELLIMGFVLFIEAITVCILAALSSCSF